MGAGKVLGAMLGFMLGLWVGAPWAIILFAIAGGLLGHIYEQQHALPEESPEVLADFPPLQPQDLHARGRHPPEDEPEEPLARDLCAVFVEVAHADGDVRREEVREIRRYFEKELLYGPDALEFVRHELKRFLSQPPDLDAAVESCESQLPAAERHRLLHALFELALADGAIQRSEREVLRRVARGLRISEADEQDIAATHLGAADAHYAALGLTPEASDAEVKRAFRRLAAEYHPDKASHAGKGAAEQAARRFQEVRDAYEEIRRLRGL
jgi:DnaJ like chaperone protein